MGRPSIAIESTSDGISPIVTSALCYDLAGRERRKILPAPEYANVGAPSVADIIESAKSFYGDRRPYTEISYDALGRSVSHIPEGEAFAMRPVKKAYRVNKAGEVPSLKLNVNGTISLSVYGHPAGTLTAECTTDEDGRTVEIWKNLMELTVMERNGDLTTGYVYDDYQNLRFVLPPSAMDAMKQGGTWNYDTTPFLHELAYRYEYDDYGRCVAKTLPGCGKTTMVYDKADRIVFLKDANLHKSGRTRFFLFDRFGRIAVEGSCKENPVSSYAKAVVARYNGIGAFGGYTADIALDSVSLGRVCYYDNYSFLNILTTDEKKQVGYSSCESYPGKTNNIMGLMTGETIYTLEDTTRTCTAYYYDNQSRPVCRKKTNHLGGSETYHTAYTFTGNISREKHIHKSKYRRGGITEETVYSYDGFDRLASKTFSINGKSDTLCVSYSYDAVGRLEGKMLGGASTTLRYNTRGWMTSSESDLFSEYLAYNSGNAPTPSRPRYNGNVAASAWKWKGVEPSGYNFTYDDNDRLVSASYGEGT